MLHLSPNQLSMATTSIYNNEHLSSADKNDMYVVLYMAALFVHFVTELLVSCGYISVYIWFSP
jgi:hypothetical protein